MLQAAKLVVTLCAAAVIIVCYLGVASLTLGRSHDFTTALDRQIPFVPWTWWIYFPGYIGGLLLAVGAARNRVVFFRGVVAMLLAQGLSEIVFCFAPSSFPRPVGWGGTGLTADALRWMWRIDPPNNTFPSVHMAFILLSALAMWEERNPVRYISTLLALGIFVTIHTTKQHYWIDAVGGTAMAFLCFALVFRVYPKVCRRPKTPGGVRLLPQ